MDDQQSYHYLEPVRSVLDWFSTFVKLADQEQIQDAMLPAPVINFHWAVTEGLFFAMVAGKQEDLLIQIDVHAAHLSWEAAKDDGPRAELLLRMPHPAGAQTWERPVSDYLHRCRNGTLIVSRRWLFTDGLGGAEIWILRDGEVVMHHPMARSKQRHNMHDMSSYFVDTCFSLSPDERHLYCFSGIYLAAIDLQGITIQKMIVDDRSSAVDGIHAVGEEVVVQRYSWDFVHYTPSLKAIGKPELPDGTAILTFSYLPQEYQPHEIGELGGFAYRIFRQGKWDIQATWGIRYHKPINDYGYVSDFSEDFDWAQIAVGDRFLIAYRHPELDGHMETIQIMNDYYTQVHGQWSFNKLLIVEFPSLRHTSLDLHMMDPKGPLTDFQHLRYHFREDGASLLLYSGMEVFEWAFQLG